MAQNPRPPKSRNLDYSIQVYTPNQEEVIRRFDKMRKEDQQNVIVAALHWAIWFFTGVAVGGQETPDETQE